MNILISAYAVSPNHGSEPGVGWNWTIELAKYCNIHVITEAEFKNEIEAALQKLPHKDNIHFYYNDIGEKARKMCWNQGDYRFYYYYKKWQKETYKIALEIIKNNNIDIIHQLNMIGYREPGYLWKIKEIPKVWGPIGGFGQLPLRFLTEFSFKNKISWIIKNIINEIQVFTPRVLSAIRNFDALVAATPSAMNSLRKLKKRNTRIVHIPETGTYKLNHAIEKKYYHKLKIVWVGKIVERKGLPIALKSIYRMSSKDNIEFHIVGSGQQLEYCKKITKKLNIDNVCIWHGNISRKEVLSLLQKCDLFFFTSMQDATSSVVLEALTYGLPVMCHDASGYGAIIDEKCGFKIPFKSPDFSVRQFSTVLDEIVTSPSILKNYSKGAIIKSNEHTWFKHASQMFQLYNDILNQGTISNK